MMVICNECECVHFKVSQKYVDDWEQEWIGYFNTKPKLWLEAYGITDKPPSTEEYYKCFRCGNYYKNFRIAEDYKCPIGSTIRPILDFNE